MLTRETKKFMHEIASDLVTKDYVIDVWFLLQPNSRFSSDIMLFACTPLIILFFSEKNWSIDSISL